MGLGTVLPDAMAVATPWPVLAHHPRPLLAHRTRPLGRAVVDAVEEQREGAVGL